MKKNLFLLFLSLLTATWAIAQKVPDGGQQTSGSMRAADTVLMQTGTVTTCDALFYDTGGEAGNYSAYENLTLTFMPATSGDRIKVTFLEFETENNYDKLFVYNGTSTSDPLIATLTGETVPADLFNGYNSNGALTFNFYSDGGVQRAGWKATVECYTPLQYNLTAVGLNISTATVNTPRTVPFVILNQGTLDITAAQYTVQLQDAANNILATANGVDLAMGAQTSINLTWTPTTAGTISVKGVIIFAQDQAPEDNATDLNTITVYPEGIHVAEIGPGAIVPGTRIPFDFYYGNNYAQSIYTNEQIGISGGLIDSIVYKYNFPSTNIGSKGVKVWMGETTLSNLDGGFIDPSTLTLVFDGNLDFPGGEQELYITLQTPYIYNGGNLVIYTYKNYVTSYYSSSDIFYLTATIENRSRYRRSDSQIDPSAPSEGSVVAYVPEVSMFFSTKIGSISGNVTCAGSPVEDVTVKVVDNPQTTTTNATGDYAFPAIAQGTYSLEFSKLGYNTVVVDNVTVTEGVNTVANATITLIPKYTVSGTVKKGDTQEGVPNVAVKLTGYADYTDTTDASGSYSIPDVIGAGKEYVVTVDAIEGYQAYSGTVTVDNANITHNITLNELAYPVVKVIATIEEPNVNVTWYAPGTVIGSPQWIQWDNGENHTAIGTNSAADFTIAQRFSVENLQVLEVVGMTIKKVKFFPRETGTFTVKIWTGGSATDPGTLAYEQVATDVTIHQWNEVELTTPVVIPYGQELWFGVQMVVSGGWPAGCDAGPAIDGFGNMMYFGDQWVTLLELGPSLDFNWNLGAYVDLGKGREIDLSKLAQYKTNAPKVNIGNSSNLLTELRFTCAPKSEQTTFTEKSASRAMESYTLYRLLEGQPQAEWTQLVASTTDTFYVDNGWGQLDMGVYQYAVVANYTNGVTSMPRLSNTLAKDMEVEYNLNITTNSGDPATGAIVKLTNLDGILDHIYQDTVVSETGVITFPTVWRGTYNITVTKEGFKPYAADSVVINENATYPVQLIEIINKPFSLEITQVGNDEIFTWNNLVTVILEAHDVWGNGWGYQLLLDADSVEYGQTIPEGGQLWNNCSAPADLYDVFEYKIPVNADPVCETTNAVIDGEASIQIPPGTYDFCVVCPYPGGLHIAVVNGRKDNYLFEAGKTYRFKAEYQGGDDVIVITVIDNSTKRVVAVDRVENQKVDEYARIGAGNPKQFTETSTLKVGDYVYDAPSKDRSLVGYTVYLDGVEVQSGITDETYTFIGVEVGNHTAGVKAVYSSGSSEIVEIPFVHNIPVYNVDFIVTNKTNGNPVDSAIVVINSDTLYTDASGFATINLKDSTYSYTVSQFGYSDFTGEIIVEGENVTVNVALIPNVFSLTLVANPAECGTVSGGGNYRTDDNVIIQAYPVANYQFVNWTKGAEVISINALHIYTMPGENDTLTANFAPYKPATNVQATVSGNNVNLTWNAPEALEAPEVPEVLLTEGFDSGIPADWSQIDANSDGLIWSYYGSQGHNSQGCASSQSYSGGNITPDNYLITPLVEGATRVNYWVKATHQDCAEHYSVMYSSTGTNATDFTEKFSETLTINAYYNWQERTVDLPAGTKYIAFRHHNCTGQLRLLLDDVTVYGLLPRFTIAKNGDEIATGVMGTTYTDHNVAAGTYEYCVTAVYPGGTSLPACAPSIDISLHTVTFNVLSGGNPVEGASIAIESEILTTGASGVATIELADGTYPYTISKIGYIDVTGTAPVSGSDVTISETISLQTFTLTLVANPAAGGTVTGGGSYKMDSVATVKATPESGYRFVNWTEDGIEVDINTQFNYVMPGADVTLTANFAPQTTYSVSFTVKDNASNPIQGATVTINSETLTTNASGRATTALIAGTYAYTISKVGYIDENGNIEILAHANINRTLNYQEYSLELFANPAEGGTVNDTVADGNYIMGTEVELTATPAEGYYFVNWTKGSEVISIEPQFTYIMPTEDVALTANFEVMPEYTVTFTVVDTSNIAIKGATVAINSDTLTTNIYGNATIALTDGAYSYEISKPGYDGTNDTIEVNGSNLHIVIELPYHLFTLTAEANPVEGGTVAGGGDYIMGTEVALTATPAEGYYFVNWTKGSDEVSTAPLFTYTMPVEDVTLTANFEPFSPATNVQAVIDEANVNVTWDAPSSGEEVVLLSESFDTELPSTWTLIDADGDGQGWKRLSPATSNWVVTHSGDGCVGSFSWSGNPFTPNNYLITPLVEGATRVTYFHAVNAGYPADHYAVMVSTTGTNADDFQIVFEETPTGTSKGDKRYSLETNDGTKDISEWFERSVVLPAGTKYIAFRHFNCTDQNYILLDDITVYSGVLPSTYTITKNGVDLATGITETNYTDINVAVGTYEYCVKAVYTEGTALPACAESVTIVPKYTVTFTVKDTANNAVEGATVTINSQTRVTNASGIATILLADDNYPYTVSKTGYLDVTGNVVVSGADVPVDVTLPHKQYTLTLVAIPSGGGTLTGGGSYIMGTPVIIKATPATSYNFINWTKDGVEISNTALYTYVMPTEDVTLTANFAGESSHAVTFIVADIASNPVAGASIAINSETLTTSSAGKAIIYLANGTYAYTVSKSGYVDATDSITVDGAPVSVDVTLTPQTYTLTLVADPAVGGTVSGGGDYQEGATVNVTATANTGYNFINWTKDGAEVNTSPTFDYIMPSENVTLTANFASASSHTVTFAVADTASNPVEGATVTINSHTRVTNASGVATINLEDGIYAYTVSKTGYVDATDSVTVNGADTTVNVTLTPTAIEEFTVTFTVKDTADSPIAEASIAINSETLTTDASGVATIDLANGAYAYTVTKAGYEDATDIVTVEGTDVPVSVTLTPIAIEEFTVTFTVKDTADVPIAEASIAINSETLTTDASGVATIALANGTYAYTVIKAGYEEATDSVTVNGADTTVNVTLTPTEIEEFTVTFTVKDTADVPIAEASIAINSETLTTDASGVATIALANGTYAYTVTKAGYEDATDSVTVEGADVPVSVTLTPTAIEEFTVTFTVVDGENAPIEEATVAINSETLTTDASGVATIDLANGTYAYTVSKAGYEDATDSVTVEGADVPVSVTLTPQTYTLTLVANPEAGGTLTGGGDYQAGATVNVTATANTGYNFVNWTKGEDVVSTVAEFEYTMPGEDVTLTANFEAIPTHTVTFTVVDAANAPIEDASVVINSETLTTNASGVATISLADGTYAYTVTKIGYSEATGDVVVDGADVPVSVTLTLQEYTLTLVASPVEGGTVNDSVANGNYHYGDVIIVAATPAEEYRFVNWTKDGIVESTNAQFDYTMPSENVTLTANFAPASTHTVTFTVVDTEEVPIAGATVAIDNETHTTNNQGIAIFNLNSGEYSYIVSKLGYTDVEGSFVVDSTDVDINVSMEQTTFTITFHVVHNDVSLQDVTINVADTVLTTDAQGNAVIQLVNGSYTYTATKEGYNDFEGEFIVYNADQTVTVNMTGIEGFVENIVLLYPNPVESTLTIERNSSDEVVMEIYNINGALVGSIKTDSMTTTIDVEMLGSGAYFVRIVGSNETTVHRFIKR